MQRDMCGLLPWHCNLTCSTACAVSETAVCSIHLCRCVILEQQLYQTKLTPANGPDCIASLALAAAHLTIARNSHLTAVAESNAAPPPELGDAAAAQQLDLSAQVQPRFFSLTTSVW